MVSSRGAAIPGCRRCRRSRALGDGDVIAGIVPVTIVPRPRHRHGRAHERRHQALRALRVVAAGLLPEAHVFGHQIRPAPALAEPCRQLEPGPRTTQREGRELKVITADRHQGRFIALGHGIPGIGVSLIEVAERPALRIEHPTLLITNEKTAPPVAERSAYRRGRLPATPGGEPQRLAYNMCTT